MTSFFKNMRIRNRILLIVLLPLAGLTAISGLGVLQKATVTTSMAELQALADLAPTISAMVHELQKERGNSAGFIAANGTGAFRNRLDAQRRATDEVRERFTHAIATFDVAAYGEAFVQRIEAAQAELARLDDRRDQVSDLDLSVGEMANYYTGTITLLLDSIAEMAVLSDDPRVSNTITAYISLLQAKERAGIERAMGANGFNNGVFSPAVHQRFISLVAQQQAFLSVFETYASPEQRAFFAETVRGDAVEAVEQMRESAIGNAYGGAIEGIDGATWFDTITRKIDLLKAVEDRVAADLQSQAAAVHDAAQFSFIVMIGITLALIGGTVVLATIVIRGIAGPLSRLTTDMIRLSEGDKSIRIVARS